MTTFAKQKEKIAIFLNSTTALKSFKWLIVFLFPLYLALVANYVSFSSTEQLRTLIFANTGSFVYGLLLLYLVFLFFIAIIPNLAVASFVTALIFITLSLIDFFKYAILKEHFFPSDIYLAQNAASFTEFLGTLEIPKSIWTILFVTLFYCIVLYFIDAKISIKRKVRVCIAPLVLILLCQLLTNNSIRKLNKPIFGIIIKQSTTQTELYQEHGFITAFALNFIPINTGEPEHYSKSYVQSSFKQYLPDPASGETFQNPDIIVVLSEAYWDPTVLNDVSFSADPLENYREIAKTNPSGKMISPTFGGGTVRPEFEILTGMSTSALPPGNIPYQQYVKDDIFSFPRTYKNLGYDAVGLHTYQKTFYDRDKAYPLMGFDNFLGEYDLHAEQHWNSGPYITDETIAEEVIYQLEQPHEVATFVMAITMENHSMYQEKFEEQDRIIKVTGDALSPKQVLTLENYAAGVRNSDLALKTIYDYVMQREKPTIVLWYGDHLPTLGENFDPYTTTNAISSTTAAQWTEAEKYTMFATPYVMFSNYDTGQEYLAKDTEYVSPYLLPALMANYIDAPECIQTNFLLDLYRTCPVMSKYYDLYAPSDDLDKRNKMLELHELMTYDMLIGNNYIAEIN
ncbi:MAG: LTA synthase family protein [Anaerotignum sp.]